MIVNKKQNENTLINQVRSLPISANFTGVTSPNMLMSP